LTDAHRPLTDRGLADPDRFEQQLPGFQTLFRAGPATKQFSAATKPFPASAQTSGNSGWLSTWQQNGG
jgi:hypothetical protein